MSCRAITSYERFLATHVVTLASCKPEFTVLELVVATIYHAAHINQQHGFTLASFRARGKDRHASQDQGHLLVGVTDVRVAVLRAAQYFYISVALYLGRFVGVITLVTYSLARHTVSRLSKSNKRETSVYEAHNSRPPWDLIIRLRLQ